MNKKLFFGLFAATGMLFATSCSDDELQSIQSGNEAQVTFALGLEGGIASRAISDGMSVDKLVYAVYDADNKLITTIAGSDNGGFVKDNAFQNGLTENVNITLAKGQTYTVVFWAQDETCNAYSVTTETDGIKVAVDYNGQNNDETRDAFFKAETFKVSGNAQINVTLKRPFAQVNVGVTKADWDAAVASGVDVEESKVVIKNAATGINLLDGTVTGEAAVEYAFATIPAKFATEEVLTVDVDGDGTISEDENYKYLSMSYILTAAEKSTLESLVFTFDPINGENIEFKEGLTSVPVQRNWRTNILGKLLTGDIEFNIIIDPAFIDDHIKPAGDLEQILRITAATGGTVTLTENVTLSKTLNVNADMIINLNGNSISGEFAKNDGAMINNSASLKLVGGTIKNTTMNGDAIIRNEGNLVLDGVTIQGAPIADGSYPSYAINNFGTLVVEEGTTITSDRGTIYLQDGSDVTINGGNINVTDALATRVLTAHVIYAYGSNSKLTINDGNFAMNYNAAGNTGASVICPAGATIDVYGGNFSYAGEKGQSGIFQNYMGYGAPVKVYGGTYNDKTFEKNLATGYAGVDNGDGTWTVAKEITSANIVEVLNNLSTTAPTTLVLSESITSNENVIIPEGVDVTINLNSKTITSSASDAFVVNKGATLTISGNGKVEANGAPIRAIGGKVIVEGGEFTQTGAWNTAVPTYRYSVDSREGGEIIIKDGTFKTNNGLINVNANSSLVIDGGNFEFENNKGGTRHFAYVSGKLTINNGVFKGVADSNAGGCFFCGAAAGCEILINDGKFTSLWTSGSPNKIFEVYYGGSINVTGGLFNTNGGIASFVEANTDYATKDAYPYKAK